MRSVNFKWALAAVAVVLPLAGAASAASFSVIGDVPGGPNIGAIKGQTLYGVVPYNGSGTLFSLGTTGTYKLLHSFNANPDGSQPNSGLAMDGAGNLYGTTSGGGANGGGTVWKFSTANGTMTTLYALGAAGDGAEPGQGPVVDARGTVFAAAFSGAIDGYGDVFRVGPTGTHTTLYKFQSLATDGHCPASGVIRSRSGMLFGTTLGNGYGGDPTGTVWQLSPSGALKTLYVFQNGSDGEYPNQSPVLDRAGNLYGTTATGSASNFAGALWVVDTAGTFAVLHEFDAATDGSGPSSPLLLNIDGNLYGTTSGGGAHGYGTVFRFAPSGKFTVLHSFANTGDGAVPQGGLVHDSQGAIYGGTEYGPVFKIIP